ncbi:hypothetical protein H5410_000652 [Solanum commersonii]|uniref:PB1-like domain-containing protein n=1 Tax=Solanum commersonii TaxID=4109 RepID=A0A9J6AXW1_SOLCO|nr:hypothetical protein H5410_000652 [Solanum commersonii]
MDIIIVTRFHHGGKFVGGTHGGGLTYIWESEVECVGIDKDHFSLMELLFYTRDLGYVTVGGFYFKNPTTNNFVLVDNDFSLLNLINDLGDDDFVDLYVQHVVDEVEVIKNGVPAGYLCGPTAEAQSENINVEVGVDDPSDLEGVETNWDISDNSQEFVIPNDDDSEIDEELRTLRNERRTKLQRKKHVPTEKIILRVAGVDRGFEDIGRNKAARYVGRLGGDEQYIDSSELDSDDSRNELDPEAVEGVDLLARRKSKKVRFYPDCVVAIFELGMGLVAAIMELLIVSRGRGKERASTSTGGNKRPKTVGFGIYTDDISGRQTLNFLVYSLVQGERVVTPVVFKCATPTHIDIGYKPRGLKWKGKDVFTTPQLQRMSKSKGVDLQTSSATRAGTEGCDYFNMFWQKNRRPILSCVHEVFNSALTLHRQNTFASEEVEIDKLDISFAVKKTNEEFFFYLHCSSNNGEMWRRKR